MTRRRRVLLALALALGLLGGGTAVALLDDQGQDPDPVTRVERFWQDGPSAEYAGDTGGIGEVDPLVLTTSDDAAAHDAVIELSYTARTRGPGPFVVGITVDTGEADGDDVPTGDDLPTQPRADQRIEPGSPATGSVRVLVRGLEPGTTYRVTPTVGARPGDRPTRVALRGVLATVELTPAAAR